MKHNIRRVATCLLPGAVRALPRVFVVVGPVEGHELLPGALCVVHLVALFDGDLVHLDGAAVLAGHQDLRRHNLPEEGLQGGPVHQGGESVGALEGKMCIINRNR